MSKVTVYRGPYPTRIESVWTEGRLAMVRTNDGQVWECAARRPGLRLPQLGQDVLTLPPADFTCTFLRQSALRRAAGQEA